MTQIQTIKMQSELAMAAYANLTNSNLSNNDQQTQLRNAGFSSPQAQYFASRYAVVLPTYHDATSDLDVTVFKDPSGHWLYGGDDDCTLACRESNDCLKGNSGNNMLTGCVVTDTLNGGKDTLWRIAA